MLKPAVSAGTAKTLSSRKLLVRALLRSYAERCMGAARHRWLGALCFRLAQMFNEKQYEEKITSILCDLCM